MQDDAAEIIAWLATPEGEAWSSKRARNWITVFATIKRQANHYSSSWSPTWGDPLLLKYFGVTGAPDWPPEYPARRPPPIL